MDPERWQRIDALLEAALDRDPAERSDFLEQACDDPALRHTVDALLAAEVKLGGFLEAPAVVAGGAVTAKAGDTIGPYRIDREIDHGGMGTVYLASRADDAFKRQVAIKLLNPGMASANLVRRFRSERQILASLDHPYIARLFEGGTSSDGRPYLVMEYVDGLPVDEYCDRERLTVVQRLGLFRKICSAVHYAHQNLVVHRDIKPSNILVTAGGEPRLLDFGIAKLLDPEGFPYTVDVTVTGLRPMTPHYASPEQIRGEPITTASDVYSLGVLLYKLLAGRLPFQLAGLPPREVERVLSEEEPPRLSSVCAPLAHHGSACAPLARHGSACAPLARHGSACAPSARRTVSDAEPAGRQLRRRLAGDLDNIVLMALRKEPARRYGSVEQLSEDLRRHLEGLPVTARQNTFTYQLGTFVRRHKLAVAVAGVILALVVAFAVAMAQQAAQTARQRDRVELERDKAELVSAFLVDLFEIADPGEAKGNTITAREILDQAADQVRREFGDQPEVQARLLDAIGTVYLNLGLYDRSAPLLEQALATRETELGERHLDVAESLVQTALLYRHQVRYAEAEALYRRALAIREAALRPDHPEVAEVLKEMAILHRQQSRYAEAEGLLFRALAIFRQELGEEHASVARCLRVMGGVRMGQGRYDEAEGFLKEALAIDERIYGELHWQTAISLYDLGTLSAGQAEYAEAESYFRRALPIQAKILTEGHPRVADIYVGLGYVLKVRGRYAEAESQYRRALEIYEQAFGGDHSRVANCLFELGDVLSQQDRIVEAEPLLARSVAIREKILGRSHHSTAESLLGLAMVHAKQGRPDEAERLFGRAFAIWQQHPRHADTRGIPEAYAAHLRAAGRPREATELEARATAWRTGASAN